MTDSLRIYRDARIYTEHVTADSSMYGPAMTLDELEAFTKAARELGLDGDTTVVLGSTQSYRVADGGTFRLELAWRDELTGADDEVHS